MPLKFPSARTQALLAGALIAALGLTVMAGWHLAVPAVIQIHPSFVPMQYNTALGFLLAGVGLLGACGKHGRVALWAGAAVGLIGFLTLLTHIFSADLGLDELFMQHYITVATSRPGRMAPNTAVCFTLTGVATLLAGLPLRSPMRWQIICLLSALAIGFSSAALIGYVAGVPTAYGWGNLTRMAVHTALGFVVLGSGLIALSWHTEPHHRGWQPWAIGLIASTITVSLWLALATGGNGAGHAGEFVLVFGLVMALALSRTVAYSSQLRRAVFATEIALVQLNKEVMERKKAEDQVRQLAFYDMLTQLPNRLLLSERLQQNLGASKRNGHFGAVLFMDLDNFKALNDTHGHAVGDLLLIEAARRLAQCVRETDTVARFGGDEFVVILGELAMEHKKSEAQALLVAEKILLALSAPYQLASDAVGGTPVLVNHHCTVSIGIALFNARQAAQDDVLKWADAAMYQAKAAGRSLIRVYNPA